MKRTLVVALLMVLLVLSGCSNDSITKSQTSDKTVLAGEEGILDNGIDISSVAVTKEALNELNKAANAKDEIGYEQIFLQGNAFLVKSGTSVLVLDNDVFTVKVRILEGEHRGKSGWVPYEWVTK